MVVGYGDKTGNSCWRRQSGYVYILDNVMHINFNLQKCTVQIDNSNTHIHPHTHTHTHAHTQVDWIRDEMDRHKRTQRQLTSKQPTLDALVRMARALKERSSLAGDKEGVAKISEMTSHVRARWNNITSLAHDKSVLKIMSIYWVSYYSTFRWSHKCWLCFQLFVELSFLF